MRRRLRAGTKAWHTRVERLCPFGPALDRASYVEHLELRFGFQVAMEAALARWDDWQRLGFPHPSGGVALLRADLLSLGLSERQLDRLPRCGGLVALTSSLERALGGAYVLEGAKLGGQVIVAQVASTLGLAGDGVRFLTGGLGPAPARARFDGAMDAVERHAAGLGEDAREAIVAGARDTFAALARWLERGLHRRE